jgi:hypothetical protein
LASTFIALTKQQGCSIVDHFDTASISGQKQSTKAELYNNKTFK